MTIQGVNAVESGIARVTVKQAVENNANGAQGAIAKTEDVQGAQLAAPEGQAKHADKYDHDNAVSTGYAAGTPAKGVYNASPSSRVEDSSVGPDDFREVEVLKRKRESLLQQLSAETNEAIRSQLQSQIQHISVQISMKDSLAAAKS